MQKTGAMRRKEFERVAPEAVGIPSAALEQLLDELESGFTEMHGLMVMRHGKVCAEGWWAPYAPGLRHGLQSLTKTYAATAVGIAYTEGLLKLEDRILDIFPEEAPEHPSENLRKLTVRDVLCMGCGMETMPGPTKDWIREFLATPVVHEPGTTYMYNSMGSTLLGAIVRKLTGLGLHDYLTPRLFEKIGIDPDSLSWMRLPDGMEVGGGGLYSTTENNLRLMKLYAGGGVWEGERILAADYAAKAVSLQNESATEALGNPDALDNFVGYGFQIWMCRPEGVYRADGAMGQFAIVVPDKDMILSINETATGAHWAQKTLDTVWAFLEKIGPEDALPENAEASLRLKRRMERLALPAPAFSPYSGMAEEVSGAWFQVTSGKLTWRQNAVHWMSGWEGPGGMERFRLRFLADSCVMTYVQDGVEKTVAIATDGTRRLNLLPEEGSPISKLVLSGHWSKPNTFTVTARWIETCFEEQYHFAFTGDAASIRLEPAVGGFGPVGGPEEEPALARKCAPGTV